MQQQPNTYPEDRSWLWRPCHATQVHGAHVRRTLVHRVANLETTVSFQVAELAKLKNERNNARRLGGEPVPSNVGSAEKVENAEELTALRAVLREFGFKAYEDGARVDPATWLKRQLSGVGEPIKGGTVKPAAS